MWSEDRARTGNSDPADKRFSWDLEVLHGPEPDESTSAAQPGLAVDGYGAMIGLAEMLLDDLEVVLDDLIRRA